MGKKVKNLWTEDPRDVLRASADFDLAAMDRNGHPGWEGDKAAGEAFGEARGPLLSELQERLFAHGRAGGKKAVLCVVQGLDTAGKGGVARHVMGKVDPQGVALRSFGVPTEEELRHHYLWRIRRALPNPGRIGVFDRSHYEDVLVVRVEDLVGEDQWSKRYDEINKFEQQIVDSGTTVLKFALMVSHDEQGKRLMERLDRPDKRWKYSTGDLETRAKWDAYQEAYADVFRLTNTDHAPWYVIPAGRKWYSRLAITEILTRTLAELKLGWPKPRWKVETQRRRLAESMSAQALTESLADTEDTVEGAVEDMVEVQRASVKLRFSEADTDLTESRREAAEARLEARRAELQADLEATLAQKRELTAARVAAAEQAEAEAAEQEVVELAEALAEPAPEGFDPASVGVFDAPEQLLESAEQKKGKKKKKKKKK